MIIHFENGRLGNQLFQYCGLRHYFQDHRLIVIGCEALQRNFALQHSCIIPRRVFGPSILYRLFKYIVFSLVFTRLLCKLSEDNNSDTFKPIVSRGLLRNVLVTSDITLQYGSISLSQAHPRMNQSLVHTAFEWLSANKLSKLDYLVFVHIRRGDYLKWPSKEFPAVLGLAWYYRAINYMRCLHNNSKFIIMGDDPFYNYDIFSGSCDFIVSRNSPEVDLALMSICSSGITSASSFAWWGAFYAQERQKQACLFLAPRYWIGHRSGNWYPKGIITDWMTYLD